MTSVSTVPTGAKTKKLPRGGSRKGIPNKTTKELKDMILGAFNSVGGEAYLAEQAVLNPTAFMSLLAKLLPKDVNVGGQAENPLLLARLDTSTLTDDQLRALSSIKINER